MKEKPNAILARKKAERERPRSLQEKEDKVVNGYLATCLAVIVLVFGATPAYAAGGDPIATINNLSTFIFSAIRAIGIIILGLLCRAEVHRVAQIFQFAQDGGYREQIEILACNIGRQFFDKIFGHITYCIITQVPYIITISEDCDQ